AAGRVAERLAADGQDWATVEVAGRNVRIGGTAPSPELQDRAVEVASAVDGVRTAANASGLLAVASPYVWSARKAGKVVTLSGNVPSEATRNSVLASARRALPQAEIHDEMVLARGAPISFNSATAFALDRLAGLAEGAITMTDGTLAVSGVATSSASYADARAAFLNEVPGAVTLGPVDVLPVRADPFVWSASYDGESVTLEGYVPNEVVHETLVATVRAVLARAAIVDRMTVASGEPEGFAEAASFAVNALGQFQKGGVTLDGLTLDIAGVARSVDDYETVSDGLARGLPPGMKVVSNAIVPAPVSPYGWSATRDGGAVVLSGYVPSRATRDEVATLARSLFAGLDVTDKVRVASGEPKMDWIGAIKFAMSELAELATGSVTLGDKTYAIEGEAASPEAFTRLMDATGRTLPASLALESAEVVPPKVSPYRFSAERAPRRITLAGFVPTEKDKKTILATARRTLGAVEIVDQLGFASGAPADFVEAASTVLQAVARLAGGRAEIIDGDVEIDGGVYAQGAVEEIVAAAEETLPKGFMATISVVTRQPGQPLTAEQCDQLLQDELQTGRIEFDGSKATLSRDSFGLLDRIAATLVRCPQAKVEVGAHSDSEGSASRNRDRTQSRAEAVVDYLVDAAVMRERLTAVGYGETVPVADNSTAEGKAANRRVEFKIALPDGG
ncbi:MAG: BON domain-containing protein, partial [Bauldia sp.]